MQQPDRHLVVRADHRVRHVAVALGEKCLAELLAAGDSEQALRTAHKPTVGMAAQHVHESPAPLASVGRGRRPIQVVEPPAAVVLDQVSYQRGRSRPVVGGHHIGRALARVPSDDNDGQPLGQAGQEGRRDDSLTDQQPVDLAGQRQQARQVGLAALFEAGDHQRPVEGPDPRLDPAQDPFDVVLHLWRRALHADQADHVLAAAGQALRGAVGHVAELIDDGEHPSAGRIPHPVLPVHDSGHRRGGDARDGGDVIERHDAASFPLRLPHPDRPPSGGVTRP